VATLDAVAARSATEAKSSFISNMSHELHTPLTGMLGFVELMDRETHEPMGNLQYREYVGLIWKSGRHILRLINDILDFSKIEAGGLELHLAPFDLAEVTDDAIEIFAGRAHEQGIALACFVAPDVPMGLIGDTSRLSQIVLNLVGNEIKLSGDLG
jgi:signal transduction histidine kinase